MPYGFLYPIPRGWQVPRDGINRDPASPWDGDGASEEDKSQWREFRIITRILTEKQYHRISELVFNNHKIMTRINYFTFYPLSEEYYNLYTILKRPRFRRFEVSLLIGYLIDEEANGWDIYRNGDLYKALARPPDLEHISLQSNYEEHSIHLGGSIDKFISLFSMFPIEY